MIVIFDLDGCVSDDRHRKYLLPNYEEYHSLCAFDPPANLHVIQKYDDHHFVFVTGRTADWYTETYDWIRMKLGILSFSLLMRPVGDYRPAPELKLELIKDAGIAWRNVAAAHDDREDILAAYRAAGCTNAVKLTIDESAAEVLRAMADTFEAKNTTYGNNYLRVAPVVKALFPDGVPPHLVVEDRWHLFELLLVKLTRFAVSELTHIDSIHDAGVYAAMVEADLRRKE